MSFRAAYPSLFSTQLVDKDSESRSSHSEGQNKQGIQQNSRDIAIRVSNLSKCFLIYSRPEDRLKQSIMPRLQRLFRRQPKQYAREFWALQDISFEIKKGSKVGIIGRNGSGKSTLLQLIYGTLLPTSGIVETYGRVAALLELGSGFNPEFTGRENVYMNAAVLGLSKEETSMRYNDIAAFADIGDFIEQPVKIYSSGMMMRLAFSVAINVDPEILIVDEALAVGDVAFQRKCMRKIEELNQCGVTLLFVSHDIETVKKICTNAIYLKQGGIQHQGCAKNICIKYERDLFGLSGDQGISGDKDRIKTIDDLPKIDPELTACDEKVYGDVRASISDIQLTDMAREKINILNAGMEFIVSYKVRFSAFVSRPVFGMMFTDREGICIFGANTAGLSVSIRDYSADDEVNILFSLTNNLGPGIYYLTCGVHSDDHASGLVFLERRIDTLLIKSLGLTDKVVAGMAQLYPNVNYYISKSSNK